MFGAVLGALGPIVSLPFALISYRVGFNAGVTDERLPQWSLDYLVPASFSIRARRNASGSLPASARATSSMKHSR